MTYKVIQWATGGVGRAAIEGVLRHPDLELVGCWVHSDEKNGKDVGDIVGIDPTGVIASNCEADVLAIEADCVIYTPLLCDVAELERILRSGKNVCTSVGYVYPPLRKKDPMHAIAFESGVSLHGTGIHPGGITERFPLTVSALSSNITHVRAEEFSDIRTYGAVDVVSEIMMFGKDPVEARKSPMPALLGAGFSQSVDMIADALGIELDDEKKTTHESAVATAPIESPLGVIEPGLVAAQRFVWQGCVDGEPVITAAVNWLMGEENLDPPWEFGPERERFEVEVTGDPDVALTFHGLHPDSLEQGLKRNKGLVSTAMHCVNAVPAVCDAAPGLATYLDLPMFTGKFRQ